MNNGAAKGGDPQMFAVLRRVPDVAVWQLHRAERPGSSNFPDGQIANLDESTAYGVRVTASRDGSFLVRNARTGLIRSVPAR